MTPTHAMVLCAGLGMRMRPLTDTCPKPLIPLAGKPMLAHTLDRLAAAQVTHVVLNHHHLGQQLVDFAAIYDGPLSITLSDETDALLETGGGVTKALPLLGNAPFFVCNSDIYWRDNSQPPLGSPLAQLAVAWDDTAMDALLLMIRREAAHGYDGAGDFFMDGGTLRRRGDADTAPFVFGAIQILHPRLFAGEAVSRFSLNKLYDKAAATGRLHGIVFDGLWVHVGNPAGLQQAETLLAENNYPEIRA